jgi:hypothetical protein
VLPQLGLTEEDQQAILEAAADAEAGREVTIDPAVLERLHTLMLAEPEEPEQPNGPQRRRGRPGQ